MPSVIIKALCYFQELHETLGIGNKDFSGVVQHVLPLFSYMTVGFYATYRLFFLSLSILFSLIRLLHVP